MKILVINGPNMNMLGVREKSIYGTNTYNDLVEYIRKICGDNQVECEVFQSNWEGAIIDKIQSAYGNFDAIVINAAAYSHTSIAIMDALKAVSVRAVEVHMSDIASREEFRRNSFVGKVCERSFCGKGFESYKEALEYLICS